MEKLKKLADLLCWDCRYGKRNDGLFGGSCPGWRESDNECQAYQNLREIIAEPDVIVVDGVRWEAKEYRHDGCLVYHQHFNTEDTWAVTKDGVFLGSYPDRDAALAAATAAIKEGER